MRSFRRWERNGENARTLRRTVTHRYQNLDALRALAVISVLLYHYTARFPDTYTGLTDLPFHVTFGWLGVEMFFVVSGYCIAMTLGRVSTVTEFWAKRFARLQPAYMAGVLLTFGCVSLLGLPGRETSSFSAVAKPFLAQRTAAPEDS